MPFSSTAGLGEAGLLRLSTTFVFTFGAARSHSILPVAAIDRDRDERVVAERRSDRCDRRAESATSAPAAAAGATAGSCRARIRWERLGRRQCRNRSGRGIDDHSPGAAASSQSRARQRRRSNHEQFHGGSINVGRPVQRTAKPASGESRRYECGPRICRGDLLKALLAAARRVGRVASRAARAVRRGRRDHREQRRDRANGDRIARRRLNQQLCVPRTCFPTPNAPATPSVKPMPM